MRLHRHHTRTVQWHSPGVASLYTHVIHGSWTHPTQHPKLHLRKYSRFCTPHGRVCIYFTMDRHFPLQNCPFTWGIWIPIYESHLINKLQNGVFWLFFKISKIRNIRFVENLFYYSHRNFYNDDVIIMTSLVLKAQSHCKIFSCHRHNTIRPSSYK